MGRPPFRMPSGTRCWTWHSNLVAMDHLRPAPSQIVSIESNHHLLSACHNSCTEILGTSFHHGSIHDPSLFPRTLSTCIICEEHWTQTNQSHGKNVHHSIIHKLWHNLKMYQSGKLIHSFNVPKSVNPKSKLPKLYMTIEYWLNLRRQSI
jgi:hypothetical protein